MWVAEGSGEVRAQVLAIAAEVEAAQLGGGLAEQVALGEEDLRVPPAQRLADRAIAPANNGPPRAARTERQRLDRDHLDDDSICHTLIVRPSLAGTRRGGQGNRTVARLCSCGSSVRATHAIRTSAAPAASSARVPSPAWAPVATTSSISSTDFPRTDDAAK